MGLQGVYQYTVGAGGALTPMATPTVGTALEPNGIAVSPNGQNVYVANYGEPPPSLDGVSQYTVGAGGALTPMATPMVAGGNGPSAIAVSPNGQFVYVANYNTG